MVDRQYGGEVNSDGERDKQVGGELGGRDKMRESVGRVLLEIVVGWWAVIRLNLRFHLAIISTSHQAAAQSSRLFDITKAYVCDANQIASLLLSTFFWMNRLNFSHEMVSLPKPPTEWMISMSCSSE